MLDTILKKIREVEKEPDYQHEGEDWHVGLCIAESIVEDVAAMQSVAKWEPPFGDWTNSKVLCSHCRAGIEKNLARWFNYCPNCGKKMLYMEED